MHAVDTAMPLQPFTASDPAFDVGDGYEVLAQLHERRRAQGWRPVGRKIGFTNRTLWARYGVDRPMWSHVWDRTLTWASNGSASISLKGFQEPRIEPEVVFKLARSLPPGSPADSLLQAVEWMAPGFEIVHSVFPGWKFKAPDCTAAFGLHAALVVGTPLVIDDSNRAAIKAMLPKFAISLRSGDRVVDTGCGDNVLGSPLNALAHLRDRLAGQPQFPALAAGEIVTTGTLTDAWPVAPGQRWSSDYTTLGIDGLVLAFG